MLSQEIIRNQIEQYEGNQDQFVVQSLRNTAAALVEDAAKVHEGQRVLLWFDSPGTQLVQELNLRCLAKGAEIKYFARDVENDAKQLADMTVEQVAGLFEAEKELIGWADTVIIVRDDQADRYLEGTPRELRDEYEVGYKDTHLRRLINPEDGGVNWFCFYGQQNWKRLRKEFLTMSILDNTWKLVINHGEQLKKHKRFLNKNWMMEKRCS